MKKLLCRFVLDFLNDKTWWCDKEENGEKIKHLLFLPILVLVLTVPGGLTQYLVGSSFESMTIWSFPLKIILYVPSGLIFFVFLVGISHKIFEGIIMLGFYLIIFPLMKLYEWLAYLGQRFVISTLERNA